MKNQDNQSFTISKAQMEVLTHLRNGSAIKLTINSNALKLEFITIPMDTPVNQTLLLALIKRQLVFVDGDQNIILTKLGMRMANLGLRPERLGKAIHASAPISTDIKAAMHVKINGKEIIETEKKRAKRMYKSRVNKSYTK